MTCRNCKKRKVARPRGLCWTCYYAPGVRDLYPSTSKFARRGVGLGNQCKAPPHPCGAAPGSESRIRTLERRAEIGAELFHPCDARNDPA